MLFQKDKYDRDGDGRLNAREFNEWYLRTQGHDIELAERTAVQNMHVSAESWANDKAQELCESYVRFMNGVKYIFSPLPVEIKRLADMCFAHSLCAGIIGSGGWQYRVGTDTAALFVGNQYVYPCRRAVELFLKRCPVCAYDSVAEGVSSKKPPFEREGALTAHRCGSFFEQVFAKLPEFDECLFESTDGAINNIHQAAAELICGLNEGAVCFFDAGEYQRGAAFAETAGENFIAAWKKHCGLSGGGYTERELIAAAEALDSELGGLDYDDGFPAVYEMGLAELYALRRRAEPLYKAVLEMTGDSGLADEKAFDEASDIIIAVLDSAERRINELKR